MIKYKYKERINIPNNKYNHDYKNNIAYGIHYPKFKNHIIVNGKKHYTLEGITLIKDNSKKRVLKYERKTDNILYYSFDKYNKVIKYGKAKPSEVIFEENNIKILDFDNLRKNCLWDIDLLIH